MNIKQEILLLVEEEDLNTVEKIKTAIKNGRISGVKSDTNLKEFVYKGILEKLSDIPSIYKNAAIKIAILRITKEKGITNADPYLAYFNNRNKKEAKTTYKQLFTDFEEGKIEEFDFEKKVNELFKDKAVGKEDADKLYEDDTWLMVIPKTFAASCKYGANTKWCTTSSERQFKNYSKRSPLIIIINKKTNKKYQLHSETTSFMNEKDEEPKNIINIIKLFPKKIQELLIKNKFNTWNKLLINGVRDNNKNTIKKALDNGADIHAKNDFALCYAVFNGHIEAVKLLLDNGADIHATDHFALQNSLLIGNVKMVKFLLSHGAKPTIAMLLEVFRNKKNIEDINYMKALLKDVDIHAEEEILLRTAIVLNLYSVVELLLKKGANPRYKDNLPLTLAKINKNKKIIDLIKSYINK